MAEGNMICIIFPSAINTFKALKVWSARFTCHGSRQKQ